MTVFQLAGLVVLRFLRRPRSSLLFLALAALFGVPPLWSAVSRHPALRESVFALGPRSLRNIAMGAAVELETLRNSLYVLELFVLSCFAFLFAASVNRDGSRDGTRRLLLLAPLRGPAAVLGDFLGVSFVALVLHAFVSTMLVACTPIVRESHALAAARLVAAWLLAIGFVPAGFLWGLADGRARSLFRRAAVVAQLILLALFVEARILPEARADGATGADVVLGLLAGDPGALVKAVGSVTPFVTALLALNLAFGGLVLAWLCRSRSR